MTNGVNLRNPERLRCFIEVAERLSFSRAAEHLHLSQPAVSRYIKELERATGRRLFDRIGRKVALTEAGSSLLERAKSVQTALDEFEAEAAGLAHTVRGPLTLGGSTVWEYLLPAAIGTFRAKYPNVTISLTVGNTAQIVDLMTDAQLHLGFVGEAPQGRLLEVTQVTEDQLVVIAPPEHELAGKRRVAPKALNGQPFVQREAASATARLAARYLASLSITPGSILELGSHEAVKAGVRAGLGLGMLSRYAIVEELALGTLTQIKLQAPPCNRPLYVLRNPHRSRSHAQSAFVAHVISTFKGGGVITANVP